MNRFAQLKKLFLYILIASLVGSSLLAVVVVMVGDFNDITLAAILTLLSVVVHSLISLALVHEGERRGESKTNNYLVNLVLALLALSFLTSLARIWGIITLDTTWRFYRTYFTVFFHSYALGVLAIAHGRRKSLGKFPVIVWGLTAIFIVSFLSALVYIWGNLDNALLEKIFNTLVVVFVSFLHAGGVLSLRGKAKLTDNILGVNLFLIVIVGFMVMPFIWVLTPELLGNLYIRSFASLAIIDGTLSILLIFLRKLYLRQHPEEKTERILASAGNNNLLTQSQTMPKNKAVHIFGRVLFWVFLGPIILAVIFALIGWLILSRLTTETSQMNQNWQEQGDKIRQYIENNPPQARPQTGGINIRQN